MRSPVRAALVFSAVLGAVGCGGTPTEPGDLGPGGVISLTVEDPPRVSDVGTLTLTSAVCGCTLSPLVVAVNGTTVGNLPCSASASFPMPRMEAGTADYRLVVTNGVGTTGLLSFSVTSDVPGAPSLSVRAFCP